MPGIPQRHPHRGRAYPQAPGKAGKDPAKPQYILTKWGVGYYFRKNEGRFRRHGNTQFRYAMTHVAITLLVLLFLNFYTTRTSQELFFNSKQTAMVERCKLAATEFSTFEVFSPTTVSSAVEQLGSLRVSRLLVTDQSGTVIYDSLTGDSAMGKTALLPEIVTALRGNDVFSGQYRSGAMHSQAATPIYSYGSLLGAVYMSEFDASQGAIVQTLQKNVFTTTLVLEVVLVFFSLIFASIFSHRLKKDHGFHGHHPEGRLHPSGGDRRQRRTGGAGTGVQRPDGPAADFGAEAAAVRLRRFPRTENAPGLH